MFTRRSMLGALAGAAAAQTPASKRPPNFVILFADDLGYGDIGCYGSTVPTPHIDSIARDGVRFTDGYVSAAVCSPSRAALLTGRYQHRFGHEFNSGDLSREAQIGFGLPAGEKIIPQYLKAAGYASGIFGKWHLGARPGYHPIERGFDEFYGFLTGANDYGSSRTTGLDHPTQDAVMRVRLERQFPILRAKQPVADDRYLTEALAEEAAGFIERHKSEPFFLYVPFNAVHTPLQATRRYLERFASIRNERQRTLAAMTSAMDDAAGLILRKLEELSLASGTMVVFLSDNGCPEMTGAGTNGPLNGEKVTYFEGGIRVPFAARWPGRIPSGQVYRHPVVSRDLLPTFAAAAGIRLPSNLPFDGVDLMPYLRGKKGAPHEMLFWRAGKARAVRKGQWKLLEFGDSFTRLFDLAADQGETRDLSKQRPAVVKELREAFSKWASGMSQPAWPPRYREATVNGETLNWEL